MSGMEEHHDATADRNKTDLTHAVTEGASRWLLSIGAKCIETEVPVGKKWISDIAAFWSPTPTEATKQNLIPQPIRYQSNSRDPEWMMKYKMRQIERAEHFRSLPKIITIVVEVKTTFQDFNKDMKAAGKFLRERVSGISVLAVPYGMLEIKKEAPEGWWVLECSSHDGQVMKVKRNDVIDTPESTQRDIIASIAERRHNRTSNAFWNALAKRRSAEQSARRPYEK